MLKVHLCTSMRVVQIFNFIFLNCHSSLLHIILDSYRARIRMKLIFIALVALLIVSARGADEGKAVLAIVHEARSLPRAVRHKLLRSFASSKINA